MFTYNAILKLPIYLNLPKQGSLPVSLVSKCYFRGRHFAAVGDGVGFYSSVYSLVILGIDKEPLAVPFKR
jgi:hypothetical protein